MSKETSITSTKEPDGMMFTIFISDGDYVRAKLDRWDLALLDDIKHGKKSNTPLADILLGLETIMRRVEQSAPNNNEVQDD